MYLVPHMQTHIPQFNHDSHGHSFSLLWQVVASIKHCCLPRGTGLHWGTNATHFAILRYF